MLDKFKGCIFGGAIGDALGYTIEFYKEDEIFGTYPIGIQEYELTDGVALFSDDTQMSLFTAAGLLKGNDPVEDIRKAYIDWYHTQIASLFYKPYTKLYKDKRLHDNRAPGMACMSSLSNGGYGTIENPINDSKGCGGVMRIAPIGLYYSLNSNVDAGMLAAQASAMTHGHQLGYIPSCMLAYLIQFILSKDEKLEDLVNMALDKTNELFNDKYFMKDFNTIINKAIQLSKQEVKELDAIHELGQGWIAEEALAIAIYCALKHSNNFEKAIVASVNHNGDSDSTGAITGNILGCYLGYSKIPYKYINHLECSDLLEEISLQLLENRK